MVDHHADPAKIQQNCSPYMDGHRAYGIRGCNNAYTRPALAPFLAIYTVLVW